VACAVEMQLAMTAVNDRNRQAGYPEVALGIGINTGKMVVGNIGSQKRMKYGVVGQNVNLTSRIESYTVGGQIFISEGTLQACGDIVRIENAMQVMPKGVKEPLTIYEVGGIAGDYQLFLPLKPEVVWVELVQQLPVQFTMVDGKHVGDLRHRAAITKLAPKMAEITAEAMPPPLTNLRLSLYDSQKRLIADNLYVKVLAHLSDHPPVFQVNFTAIPPEAETFLKESLSSRVAV
jgi:adenylate cyclase